MSISFSQPKYPADSLIKSTEITIVKKIGLLPISIWQRISYNFNYFNCQFYPSCSNYCASAIKQYGLLKGMVIGSERITRCNPFATYYHVNLKRPFYEKDGRLIDPIHQNQNIKKSTDLFISGKEAWRDIDKILSVLKKQAKKYKLTPCIGRSHGIHAEPLTFGLKLASFYEEFKRNKLRLKDAIENVSTCAISGAVGTFANINPKIETYVAKKLKLKAEPISTQIIPRDRHAHYFAVLGIIAGSVERVATEIRHLQRSEVYELQEYFSKDQKGSSAMPHKKNPILSENLTGLARMVRSYVIPALENISLWHERDISHSSVERNIGPDANITLDFALVRLSGILEKMIVYPKTMIKNLNLTRGLVFSQEVMLELTKSGIAREKAYRLVQSHAKASFAKNTNLLTLLKSDKSITSKISEKRLDKIFTYDKHLKNVNYIFKRVFK